MTTAVIVVQVVLAAAGFVAGFLLGRVERMTAEGKTTRQRWLAIGRVAFGILVVVVVVVSYVQDSRRVACQAAWYEQATQSLRERSVAAGQSAADQKALLQATLSEDRERARSATEDYIASLDRAELIRQATPIPVPPEC